MVGHRQHLPSSLHACEGWRLQVADRKLPFPVPLLLAVIWRLCV